MYVYHENINSPEGLESLVGRQVVVIWTQKDLRSHAEYARTEDVAVTGIVRRHDIEKGKIWFCGRRSALYLGTPDHPKSIGYWDDTLVNQEKMKQLHGEEL